MESYQAHCKSDVLGQSWVEGANQDIYEVESRMPLPRPFPLPSYLDEKNSIVVQTQISHVNHKQNGHLLKVISKISLPTPPYTLEHARITQTELMRESFRRSEEMTELLRRQEELQESLSEEAAARQQLALELQKAEGLIDGYSGERTSLEQQLQKKQELQLHLEQELLMTNSRLQELEQERRQVLQERELLSRQQGALKDDAGARELRLVEAAVDVAPEADLLEETEKLMKEKVEVQLQAEKEAVTSLNRVIELEEAHKAESNDLRQQIQALEKQLEKNRRFLDEQAIDREHERDVFQQEILKLEAQLKNPQKQQASSDPYNKEVDQLTAQLREKSDWCSELLLRTEQLQRDVQNGNEENERLEMRVRELEQALLASTEMLQVEQKKPQPPAKSTPNTTLEVELQTEREALDRKEKEISNLEEQLEQFREELENKSEEVQQLQMQLEIQNKELSSQQQDLQHKGELLKALEDKNELLREFESQVECMKGEQERLKKNSEEEIDQLNDVIEKLQQELLMIAHKASDEHLHDTHHLDSQAREEVHLTSEDFDELKHKMKQLTEELTTLQASHSSLLEKYKSLEEVASRELDEGQKNKWNQLEKAFQEKTAECVVMQAQVQALEESAGYRMASLSTKIEELETSVEEKDSELKRCRLQVKQTQAEAAALHHKVSELEDKLREMVAAVQFNQVGPGAIQEPSNVQTKEPRSQKLKRQELWEESTEEMADGSYVSTDSPLCSQVEDKVSENVPVTKVVILTEKLRELEEGLCNMQKDQELQKQLLSSSEVEVVEYEKRLAVLIDLLNQMTTKPRSQTSLLPIKASVAANEDDPAASTDLLQELRQEVVATREELSSYRERNDKLQEDLQGRDATILQLKEELHQASVRGPSVTEEDPAAASRLLQEVREEAAATKEELSSYREKNDKLQEELQVRDVSIAQLQEELRQIKEAVRKSEEDLKKEAGKYSAGKPDHSEKRRETSTNERNASQMDWTDGTDRTTQTQGTVCVDKEVQTTMVQHDSNLESEEMAQVKREYAEKVRQVQDGCNTEEELNSFREQNDKLQEELQVRDVSIAKLQEKLQVRDVSIAKLQEELDQMRKALRKSGKELKKEAGKYSAATKDFSEEMRETSTKDRNTSQMDLTAGTDRTTQTHKTTCTNVEVQTSQVQHDSNVESKETAEVISEYTEKIRHMQERHDEEVKRYREQNDKLQEELCVRDVSIAKLRDELAQKNEALRKSEEELKDETGKYSAGKQDHSAKTRKTSTKGRNTSQMDCTASTDRAAQTTSTPCTDAGVQTSLVQQGSSVESEEMGKVNSENTEEMGQVQDGQETAQELNSYREQKDKLHAELEVKDQSIAKLQMELAQIKEALRKSEEDLKKEAGKYLTGKRGRSAKMRETATKEGHASQMDCTAGIDRTPQTPNTTYADAEVQTSSVQHDSNLESEEMAEVISEYTEKIGQMQDLHAAEIMDMEARHICESEGFKKEKEALQEECRALRAVIKDLYDSEAASPRLEHIPAAPFKDGSMSDSGSDWSQQTSGDPVVLHQEFRTTPEGARRDNETDLLPDRIKSLLREVHQEGMQVLSLSEMPLAEGEEVPDVTSVQLKCQGWLKERESLLTSVDKLKALISTMQIHRERESGGPFVEASKDWRAELLQAVQQVFTAERSVLRSSMYSHVQQLDTSDAVICLNQLEQKLTEQEAQQREAMEILQSADRDSLLMEISQLKAQLQQLQLNPRITGVAEQQPVLEKHAGVSLNPDALHSERMLLDELKAELAQTKLELESTLKAQHKHLTALDTLRNEVTEKAAEVDTEKKEQNEREEIEDMRLLLLEEQKKVAQLSEAVEKEKRTSTQLKQQVDHGLAQHQSQSSREQGRISELQVQLESAQARALELESALERERELHSQRKLHESQQHTVQANAEDECVQMDAGVLESLHSQLEDKQAQVVQLLGEVEGLKLEVIRVRLECDEERQAGQQGLRALQELQEGEQRLRAQVQELQQQVDRKTQQALKLQLERDQLQDQVSQIQGLGETLQPSTQTSLRKTEGEFGGLSEDGAFQETLETDPSSISGREFNVASLGAVDPKLTDTVIEQLHHIASKIKTMTSSTKGRASAEEVDSEGLAWLQNSVQSVISQLQQAPALSPAFQSTALPASGASDSLTERLLRQNAELTGFVSRLTEEKNDLRNSLVRLEKELRHAGPRGLGQGNYSHRGVDHKDTVEILLASARESWNRERIQLEKCLHQAEAEVSRLRGKIRADSLWDFADSNADSAALKRIYVKYLRSESFRKALIYQKKYLLLLLGSFQDCEAATLSLISRMGGRSSQSLDTASRRPRGFTRFRSAARVFIALSRMRYLVKRWYRTTEAGSSSSAVNRNGQVQTTAIEERRGSPYLHPGNVDGYGDLRGSSRGLTGRDSARFNTAHAETGSLTCSHLQNYDPDRALSDYITRLEALQRRLGSVQSGSFSYAQLHFGIRR
ncbi:hypothetical protein GJAV_G00101030 [Gymnothorax javanicus]|nr:hypothetical protein GJAV_G00101030 [Gymnothorax javanicus]